MPTDCTSKSRSRDSEIPRSPGERSGKATLLGFSYTPRLRAVICNCSIEMSHARFFLIWGSHVMCMYTTWRYWLGEKGKKNEKRWVKSTTCWFTPYGVGQGTAWDQGAPPAQRRGAKTLTGLDGRILPAPMELVGFSRRRLRIAYVCMYTTSYVHGITQVFLWVGRLLGRGQALFLSRPAPPRTKNLF